MLAAEVRRIIARRGSYWSALLIGLGAVVLMVIIRIYQDGDAGGTGAARRDGADLARGHDHGRARRRARGLLRHRAGHDALPRHDRRAAPPAVCDARRSASPSRRSSAAFRRSSSASSRLTPCATARSTIRRQPPCSARIWAYLVNPLVYGLVSVGVGSLLRSNGAAIGVSLGFALGGGVITGLVNAYVSETPRGYLLPAATAIVASLDRDSDISLAAAFVAVVAWLAAPRRRRSVAHAERRVLSSRHGGRAPGARPPPSSRPRSPRRGRRRRRIRRSLGRRLDRDVRQDLVEPARHVPRLLAEQVEQRRHDREPHYQRVREDRHREQQAELLADRDRASA